MTKPSVVLGLALVGAAPQTAVVIQTVTILPAPAEGKKGE